MGNNLTAGLSQTDEPEIPAVLFAISPWYDLLLIHRRRKRKKLGLCVKYGYDLRASKDRCPECGEEFVSTGVEG